MPADLFCPHCGVANLPVNTVCLVCIKPLLLKQRYQIIGKLGQGGFASVYKAKDLQFSSALRAIKEMDSSLLTPQERQEAVTTFQQEAHMLACLMHPNLPRIYDYFEEQQRWYLVMDYIDGETLENILIRSSQGKLPVNKVIQYGLQLCAVLHYLHSQEQPIIFRDIKPANIMIARDDHLYLIDFGIARFFKAGQANDTVPLGSPGYAAPEQFGRTQTTAQADIYSLGATLHYLLSGRDPSDQPFIFPPLQLVPSSPLTQALANLVVQMVALKKEDRPASVQEIRQALSVLQQASLPAKPPMQRWAFRASGPVASSPTVVNGIVYFGSGDGNFYALDASSGRKRWSFLTGSWVSSSPMVVNGIVYFGSGDRNFYALDASSGRKRWSFLTGSWVSSSPMVVNGIVYFGSGDRNFYALDASSGQKRWAFRSDGWVRSSPAVVNGIVYVGSWDHYLYALNANSGLLKWFFSTGGPVASSPTVVNGVVYFGSGDRNFYALDASSGQEKWSFPTGNWVTAAPTVANGIVYFGSNDYNLYALDAASGLQKWSFCSGGEVTSAPTVVDGIVYFGSNDYNLYALDTVSGLQKWCFRSDSWVRSSPVVVDGVVYVGSDDGHLYALFA